MPRGSWDAPVLRGSHRIQRREGPGPAQRDAEGGAVRVAAGGDAELGPAERPAAGAEERQAQPLPRAAPARPGL